MIPSSSPIASRFRIFRKTRSRGDYTQCGRGGVPFSLLSLFFLATLSANRLNKNEREIKLVLSLSLSLKPCLVKTRRFPPNRTLSARFSHHPRRGIEDSLRHLTPRWLFFAARQLGRGIEKGDREREGNENKLHDGGRKLTSFASGAAPQRSSLTLRKSYLSTRGYFARNVRIGGTIGR